MIGYWPGSAVHQRETLREPRFEDFEYSSFDEDEEESLAWMGNGMILAQMEGRSTTTYLDTVIIPPFPVSALDMLEDSLSKCSTTSTTVMVSELVDEVAI